MYANANFGDQTTLTQDTTIAVYGLGKMGLPLASVFAEAGAQVLGVDIDATVVDAVNDGRSPVDREPGLDKLVAEHGGERLLATTEGVSAAERADVMIVLVPTLVDENDDPALDAILAAASDIAKGVDTGDLVVLESTVPPGTTAGPFVSALEQGGQRAGHDFGVAHGPERTSSGRAIEDITRSYPKIVGGINEESTRAAASLYRIINEPGVIEMGDTTAAEAVKVFEGVYRDVNIALANELAKASTEWGIDAETVFGAANSQPYCDIHTPGCGVGGHCIPVYPHFVINGASDTPLLETARAVNLSMPKYTVELLQTLLDRSDRVVSKSRVLVLGLTYRAGVRELRYAPAVEIIDLLLEMDVEVYAHDPLLEEQVVTETGARYSENPLEMESLDGVILATGHEEYRDLDIESLRASMRTPVMVDGRRFFDEADTEGFEYACIGREV